MDDSLWSKRIHEPFILAALAVALTAGFGYAAFLVSALALKIPVDEWWLPLIQTHGHAQLFGWLGLFVLGMGLYFVPRLAGLKLQRVELAPLAFSLLVFGILARSIAQPALAFAPANFFLRALWLLSALAELGAMFLIARMVIATRRVERPVTSASPEYPVLIFIVTAFASLALAFAVNAFGVFVAVGADSTILAGEFDDAVIQLMLFGFAVPMAFAFSVRNLPLFLRLAMPPREQMRALAFIYAGGLALRLLSDLFNNPFTNSVGELGIVVQAVIILVFIWQIDLLRRRLPWTTYRAPNTRPDLDHLRKPTRANYPDAGEYGNFELLIYSAYAWLALVALMEIIRAVVWFTGANVDLPADAIRHSLTVGFVTLLIFGMAVRMAPGFSGKRRVAFPRLVLATFILGNLAALTRVIPLFFPSSDFALAFLGASGAIGWLAVACLAINLVSTFRSS